jgi:hypothetical protein
VKLFSIPTVEDDGSARFCETEREAIPIPPFEPVMRMRRPVRSNRFLCIREKGIRRKTRKRRGGDMIALSSAFGRPIF